MESNKDEALRCLAIAQRHRDSGNAPSALKFCQKSINLFSTPEAAKLLASLDADSARPASSNGSAGGSPFTSGTETHASAAGTKHRHTASSASGTPSGSGGTKREFTPEQHAVVKRVRACKVTEYYEILDVQRDCEETHVKKAYRKLALALHPDKNGAPNADEAFKMVSKAFQVLSDGNMRAAYDRHGSDPEDRTAGRAPAGFSSFGGSGGGGGGGGGGGQFQGEMSPEDLFNMFFGGGGVGGGAFGGGPFGDGGPMFSASFGQNGFRTTRVRQTGRAQGGAAAADTPRSMLLSLMPLIILFAFSLLSALPNIFMEAPIPDPRFSFQPTKAYFNTERHTSNLGIRYHVNEPNFLQHPHIATEIRSGQKNQNAVKKFEASVEQSYTNHLYTQCNLGMQQRERRKDTEIGFLGIGTDWDKVREIEKQPIEACEEGRKLGLRGF